MWVEASLQPRFDHHVATHPYRGLAALTETCDPGDDKENIGGNRADEFKSSH